MSFAIVVIIWYVLDTANTNEDLRVTPNKSLIKVEDIQRLEIQAKASEKGAEEVCYKTTTY